MSSTDILVPISATCYKTSQYFVLTSSSYPTDLLEQYVILQKKTSSGKKKTTEEGENGGGEGGSEEEEEEEEEALVCRVYFWQGRDASKVCWPQYSLRLAVGYFPDKEEFF